MNINARGDELGPGGKIVATRNQTMDDYYKLNTNSTGAAREMATQHRGQGVTLTQGQVGSRPAAPAPITEVTLTNPLELEAEEFNNIPIEPVQPVVQTRARPTLRGSLADSVAKQTVVEQPDIGSGQAKGPKRI